MALTSSGQFQTLNPSLNELDLYGLSTEERSRILEVVKKEQVTLFMLENCPGTPIPKKPSII